MKTTTLALAAALATTAAATPPNIIFILTDDLGYGDLGSFFQNARRDAADPARPWHATPNLDRMAAEGARLTHHYCAAPVSVPSRASLLSGLSQGHANVRNTQFDKAIADNHTLGTVLRQAGYATAIIGKWGLHGGDTVRRGGNSGTGSEWPAHPLLRGFDFFHGFLRHVEGHEHYPKEQLYYTEAKKARGPIIIWDNRDNITDGLDKCYTTDLFTARAKKWIIDHTSTAPEKPFFIYLAYGTPHAVLELPTQPYPAGGGLKGGLQWLGTPGRMINTATGTPDTWIHTDYANATYDDDRNPATPEKPWPDAYKRHATSVRRIDDAVGDLLQLLRDLNIDQNTIVVFTSDNGPAIESYLPEPNTYTPEFFATHGPFDGVKSDTWEGGLRVPAIARWPGRILAGAEVAAPCAMWDWLPTFADAAQLPAPANADGISLLPALTGAGKPAPRESLYFEYNNGGRTPDYAGFEPDRRGRTRRQTQAIRLGDLMAVRYDIKTPQDDFEIYDVVRDPKQAHNLAGASKTHIAMQTRLKALALQSRRPEPETPRPYDNELMPAMARESSSLPAAPGLAWRCYEGDFPWTPNCAHLAALKAGKSAAGPSLAGIPLRGGQNAAVVFEGFLKVPVDGDYVFEASADTGLLMRLHEATVIDADYGYQRGAARASGKVRLQAGLHPITLTYHTDGKAAPALALKWSGPGMTGPQTIGAPDFVH